MADRIGPRYERVLLSDTEHAEFSRHFGYRQDVSGAYAIRPDGTQMGPYWSPTSAVRGALQWRKEHVT